MRRQERDADRHDDPVDPEDGNHVLYLPGPRALDGSTGAPLWQGGTDTAAPIVVDGILYTGANAVSPR